MLQKSLTISAKRKFFKSLLKTVFTSPRINTTTVVSSNGEKSDFIKYLRDTWKNRNNNAGYKSCLNVFNKAMENKIKSYGFQTSHIGYFKQIRKQCARCFWLKRNNYPHKNCFKTCKGRFKICFWLHLGNVYNMVHNLCVMGYK